MYLIKFMNILVHKVNKFQNFLMYFTVLINGSFSFAYKNKETIVSFYTSFLHHLFDLYLLSPLKMCLDNFLQNKKFGYKIINRRIEKAVSQKVFNRNAAI